MSAPSASTRFCRSTRLLGLDRVGLVVGEACRRARSTSGPARPGRRAGRRRRARCARPCRCRRRPRPSAGGRRPGRARAGGRRTPRARRARRSTPVRPSGSGASAEHQVADLGEPGLQPDRLGVGAAHLDAVVLRRVVAGGEHRARQPEVAGGEVELVGRGEADHRDVGARRRSRRRRTRRPCRASSGRMSWPTTTSSRRRRPGRRPGRWPGRGPRRAGRGRCRGRRTP